MYDVFTTLKALWSSLKVTQFRHRLESIWVSVQMFYITQPLFFWFWASSLCVTCLCSVGSSQTTPSEVVSIVRNYETNLRGFEVMFKCGHSFVYEGKEYNLTPFQGRIVWDLIDQKILELKYSDAIEGDPWEIASVFLGNSFRFFTILSSDAEGEHDVGMRAVLDVDAKESARWWLAIRMFPTHVITLNPNDPQERLLSEILTEGEYLGCVLEGGTIVHKIQHHSAGTYSIGLSTNAKKRLEYILNEKSVSQHQRKDPSEFSVETLNLIEREGFEGFQILIDSFEYDPRYGICTGWKSTWSQLFSKRKLKTIQTQFVKISDVKRAKNLDPLNISFELVTPVEGGRVTVHTEPAIEYRWMNNRIVKVVDGVTLKNLDGSKFYASNFNQWVIFLLIVLFGLIGLLCLLQKMGNRQRSRS